MDLLSTDDRVRMVRFCNGLWDGPMPKWTRRGTYCGSDCTIMIGIDEWECICTHLEVCDRRAFAAAGMHGRFLDQGVWASQQRVVLPEKSRLSWYDLSYVAHSPVVHIVAGEETLDMRDLASCNNPRDVRLCICAAIRLTREALAQKKPVRLHGINLYRTATHRRVGLRDAFMNGEHHLVTTVAALSYHESVHNMRRCPAPRRRHPFSMSLNRMASLFYTDAIASLVLEALPWQWLWDALRIFSAMGGVEEDFYTRDDDRDFGGEFRDGSGY